MATTWLGGHGDNVLIVGTGNDTIDGGDGDNIFIEPSAPIPSPLRPPGKDWLATPPRVSTHHHLDVGGTPRTLPHADLSQLIERDLL